MDLFLQGKRSSGKKDPSKISLTELAPAVTLRNIFPSDDRERKETDASESRWAVKNGSIPLLLNHSGAFFSEQSKKRRIPPLQEPSHKCRVAPRHYAPAGFRRQGFSYGSGRSPHDDDPSTIQGGTADTPLSVIWLAGAFSFPSRSLRTHTFSGIPRIAVKAKETL